MASTDDIILKETTQPRRLCSEIQLFDLCDLSACDHKIGRFCGNTELLDRFEAVSLDEPRIPQQYMTDETDDLEDSEYPGYDECEVDECEDAGEWDD